MKVKKLQVLLLLCFAITRGYSQDDLLQKTAEIDRKVKEIEDNLLTFQKVEKIKNDYGYKWVFLKEKEVQIVKIKQTENEIQKNVAWYYFNGKLIFSEQNWTNSVTSEIIDHQKLYLSNEHLIAWINSENKTVKSSSMEFKKMDSALVLVGKKLIE